MNEILIRVGADRDAVGRAYPDGFDFEKARYIPGIFDSVELILSGTPHFVTVQAAPDIARKTVRVQAVLRNDGEATKAAVKFVVREARSGQRCRTLDERAGKPGEGRGDDGGCPHPDRRLPVVVARRSLPLHARSRQRRRPFRTRFGMREFKFDPATGRAMLNGKPYFMRGSNFTLYRFFEDAECGTCPGIRSGSACCTSA